MAKKKAEKEKKVDPYAVGDYVAPEGQIWVCGACGKTSRSKYGNQAQYGWDESCVMNAVLCYERVNDHDEWVAVEDGKSDQKPV